MLMWKIVETGKASVIYIYIYIYIDYNKQVCSRSQLHERGKT